MNAIEQVLLALMAASGGDPAAAHGHLADAQRNARARARRDRQIVEIAARVISGERERAAGLTLEHTVEFPADADLLSRVAGVPESSLAREAIDDHTSGDVRTGARCLPRWVR